MKNPNATTMTRDQLYTWGVVNWYRIHSWITDNPHIDTETEQDYYDRYAREAVEPMPYVIFAIILTIIKKE